MRISSTKKNFIYKRVTEVSSDVFYNDSYEEINLGKIAMGAFPSAAMSYLEVNDRTCFNTLMGCLEDVDYEVGGVKTKCKIYYDGDVYLPRFAIKLSDYRNLKNDKNKWIGCSKYHGSKFLFSNQYINVGKLGANNIRLNDFAWFLYNKTNAKYAVVLQYGENGKKLYSLYRRKNDDDDIELQNKIQNDKNHSDLTETYNIKPSYVNQSNGKSVNKNARISKQSLEKANYNCLVDDSHKTFFTKKGVPYMEGHHLIPCNVSNSEYFWKKFKRNIDCEENIICICPTCHRCIHFGSEEEKIKIITDLFEKRNRELKKAGLTISLNELIDLYK